MGSPAGASAATCSLTWSIQEHRLCRKRLEFGVWVHGKTSGASELQIASSSSRPRASTLPIQDSQERLGSL